VLEGHRLVLDADESVGGKNQGPPPKDLLLVSLAGCTAMDVISILKKMREPVSWFNLKVSSDTADEHPKKFISFKCRLSVQKERWHQSPKCPESRRAFPEQVLWGQRYAER